MKTAYDYRRESLKAKGFFGRESEMLLSWAQKGGAKSNNVFDALLEFLELNGAKANTLEDAWDEIYDVCDLKGSRHEKDLSFWRELDGEIPINAIEGWTCKGPFYE